MGEIQTTKVIDIRTAEKYTLSFPEASEFFGIGERTLRNMAAENPSANWLLHIGTHTRIKRKQFSELIDRSNVI